MIIENLEECDDFNDIANDGCSEKCQYEKDSP